MNKATITVTADNKTRADNAANPQLTASYSGFVYGEGLATLSTLPTLSTTGKALSIAGNYPITASGGAAANYTFAYVPGTLTITPEQSKPHITYHVAQSFAFGVPIAPIIPVNTGGKVPQTLYGNTITLVGNQASGNLNGIGTAARISMPLEIHGGAQGDLFLYDAGNTTVKQISADTVVTSLMTSNIDHFAVDSSNTITYTAGNYYTSRTITAIYSTPQGLFNNPNIYVNNPDYYYDGGLALDPSTRNLFLTDPAHALIKQITPDNVRSIYAGTGATGYTDGPVAQATFTTPGYIYIDAQGNKFISDLNRIRKINPAGIVSTFVILPTNYIHDLTGDRMGNIYFCTYTPQQVFIPIIYKADPAGDLTVVAGGTNTGFVNAIGTDARFNAPRGLTCDQSGNLYVCDNLNNMIRKITLTGYAISPTPSPGLTFDGKTGILSGTPTAITSPTTVYTIVASNAAGADTTNIVIAIAPAASHGLLTANQPVVHPAISPNTDGVNDALTIDNIEKYPQNKLTIINGSGAKVFEVVGYDNAGKAFKGYSNLTSARQPAGTYFYKLQYTDAGEVKTQSGYLVLKY